MVFVWPYNSSKCVKPVAECFVELYASIASFMRNVGFVVILLFFNLWICSIIVECNLSIDAFEFAFCGVV